LFIFYLISYILWGLDALDHIERVAKATNSKCIIVDTVQAILNPSVTNKNYDTTVEEYDGLRKLAHRLEIAFIVVHHCKKTTDISSAPLEKVIGSIGIKPVLLKQFLSWSSSRESRIVSLQ
jgi:predicted ATP-dependent serine protease